MTPILSFQDLEVYQIARTPAQNIIEITKKFPPGEKDSITDQIRRSSRSIKANIAEGREKEFS